MSESRIRIVVGTAGLLGVALAGYLTLVHAQGEIPPCLTGGGGCAKVQTSEFAELAGLPVAAWGVGFYAAVIASALLPGSWARIGGLVLGLTGVGFSLYLTYLELYVIEAICQWCVVSAVLTVLICAAALWRVWRFEDL